ncbi:MAG TPA: BTAD domain-containing putative transcriptional regulator, partial [Trebonia sp.]|nr:BTAD domain-containing putative transcriptional regulator [Trebonia sp.]
WNGKPPGTAPTQLHGKISALRRALGSARDVIVRRPDGYLLAVGPDDSDLSRLRSLVKAARRSRDSGHLDAAAGCLRQALDLWRGRPFAGLDSDELAAAADLIEMEYASAVEDYASTELERDGHQEIAERLVGWVRAYPLREGMRGSLITALARSGRQAEAIASYHQLRQLLADELGVDPGKELQRLYQQVLSGHWDAALPGTAVPAQLPAATADFTGRKEQTCAMTDVLTRRDGRPAALVITAVSGTGGIGKSTLAVHVAHQVAGEFPNGQLYVNLGGTSGDPADPHDVLARMLRDLGVAVSDVPAAEAERAARYRTLLARRRVLVVLDDARDTAQVSPLLPGAASCAVVVTSRARLADLPGAYRVDLDVLEEGEALELFTRIVGAARVGAEPAATALVVRACAGLPLAIRITAAKLASRSGWTIQSIAEKLAAERDRLVEFRYGDLAVRASFRLSYDGLGEPAARAFRFLGLTPPGLVSLSAAAALLGATAGSAEELLDILTEANMVQAPRHGHYQLHDLLRLYAAELATDRQGETESDDAVTRLVTWYAAALRAAARAIAQGQSLPQNASAELDVAPELIPEFDSFASGLHWCLEEQQQLVWAVRSAAAIGRHDLSAMLGTLLWMYGTVAAHMHDFLVTQQIGLESARKLGDLRAQAWLHGGLGDALSKAGDSAAAVASFEEALALGQRVGSPLSIASKHNNLATAYHEAGRCQEALTQFRLAQAILTKHGNDLWLAIALRNEAECHRDSGDYTEALTRYAASAEVSKRIDYPLSEAAIACGEGETLRRLGRLPEALERQRAALAIHRRLGSGHRELLTCLDLLARVLADLGRASEARASWTEAADIASVTGDPRAVEFRSRLAPDTRIGSTCHSESGVVVKP